MDRCFAYNGTRESGSVSQRKTDCMFQAGIWHGSIAVVQDQDKYDIALDKLNVKEYEKGALIISSCFGTPGKAGQSVCTLALKPTTFLGIDRCNHPFLKRSIQSSHYMLKYRNPF